MLLLFLCDVAAALTLKVSSSSSWILQCADGSSFSGIAHFNADIDVSVGSKCWLSFNFVVTEEVELVVGATIGKPPPSFGLKAAQILSPKGGDTRFELFGFLPKLSHDTNRRLDA